MPQVNTCGSGDKGGGGFRISFAAQKKPATMAGFRFLKENSVKTVSKKWASYRPAVIKKDADRWYVEYYYRIPEELRMFYNNKVWLRKRVFEDINRFKNDEYAELLCSAVNQLLDDGYSPFDALNEKVKELAIGIEDKREWTIQQALSYFNQKWQARGLEKDTISRYKHCTTLLFDWLSVHGLQNSKTETIRRQHIEGCLDAAKVNYKWSNRRYNNVMKYMRTVFAFLIKHEIIDKNPCNDIDLLKATSKKHKFYDEKTLAKIMEAVKESDPYLYFAIQCVYHLCIRSEKELKYFKVQNIFPERMQVLITASGSKTKSDRFIPMNKDMLAIFKTRGILDHPHDHFVFSVPHKNKFMPDGGPGPIPFSTGFFSKRFSKIRKRLGISSDYTIYGFKHTRVIHLKIDGATDAEIMSVTGHSDYGSFAKYLRDIGAAIDGSRIAGLSRKL